MSRKAFGPRRSEFPAPACCGGIDACASIRVLSFLSTGDFLFRLTKRRLVGAAAICLALPLAVIGTTAYAEVLPPDGLMACSPETHYTVDLVRRYYEANGNVVGKFNSSRNSSTLSFAVTTTSSEQSSVQEGGDISLDVAIVQVKALAGKTVIKSVDEGKTVTNSMNVDGRHYGRTQAKLERSDFMVKLWREKGNCRGVELVKSTRFSAITAWPFFAECQDTTNRCTPKP